MSARSDIPAIPVRATHDFELPERVAGLEELAYNLWWASDPGAIELFEKIHAEEWSRHRNPVELLVSMDHTLWDADIADPEFLEHYDEVMADFEAYLGGGSETWYARREGAALAGPIAYFSMEYGLHQSLAIYSGGLGVLSGDHLKSVSDLGVPLVGLGLLYRFGYFRQTIDADGMQQQSFPEYDFGRLACRPIVDADGRDLTVRIPFPHTDIAARLWLVQVGRVPLVLLDAGCEENHPAFRYLTNVLYVRGREMRLVQELILGVGGVRALRALGIAPSVWHVNEGHSILLQLERLRELLDRDGGSFDAALASVGNRVAFTTHTPVPAGNETFDRSLAKRYLDPWASILGVGVDRLLDLGSAERGEAVPALNLTAFALRTSAFANGVSLLNAEVSDPTWRHLFPELEPERPLIHAITNGVHPQTWLGPEMRRVLVDRVGPELLTGVATEEAWRRVEELADQELWAAHVAQKERLGRFVRSRVLKHYARHGDSPQQLLAASRTFDPERLTIGFARRFATYKRAGLLFSDVHRLRSLLLSVEHPVQIILAGKAHPADQPGQEVIQHIVQLSKERDLQDSIFFLPDYDMRVGQMLVQGVDLWLNTPRRPHEASGTSGQKAGMNGVLNCSILDGWWPEAYDGRNGWAFGGIEPESEDWQRDQEDAQALYQVLEDEVVPTFYERNGDDLPLAWIARMKHSIATVGSGFSSHRMVRDYVEQAYLPLVADD